MDDVKDVFRNEEEHSRRRSVIVCGIERRDVLCIVSDGKDDAFVSKYQGESVFTGQPSGVRLQDQEELQDGDLIFGE